MATNGDGQSATLTGAWQSVGAPFVDSFQPPVGPVAGGTLVSGSMGPGTKSPSLGQVTFDTASDGHRRQSLALLEGGVGRRAHEAGSLEERGVAMSDPEAREVVYGMPYAEWKARYQTER